MYRYILTGGPWTCWLVCRFNLLRGIHTLQPFWCWNFIDQIAVSILPTLLHPYRPFLCRHCKCYLVFKRRIRDGQLPGQCEIPSHQNHGGGFRIFQMLTTLQQLGLARCHYLQALLIFSVNKLWKTLELSVCIQSCLSKIEHTNGEWNILPDGTTSTHDRTKHKLIMFLTLTEPQNNILSKNNTVPMLL